MTFRTAWIEALRRAGASDALIQSSLKDDDPLCRRALDRPIHLNPGVTEEMWIAELANILKSPAGVAALMNYLQEKLRNN